MKALVSLFALSLALPMASAQDRATEQAPEIKKITLAGRMIEYADTGLRHNLDDAIQSCANLAPKGEFHLPTVADALAMLASGGEESQLYKRLNLAAAIGVEIPEVEIAWVLGTEPKRIHDDRVVVLGGGSKLNRISLSELESELRNLPPKTQAELLAQSEIVQASFAALLKSVEAGVPAICIRVLETAGQ